MSPPPDWYVGVDAGNSKTVAIVATADGTILGYGRGGCGDIYGSEGEEAAVAAVRTALDTTLAVAAAAGATGRVTHTAFCLAGIDWAADEQYWQDTLTSVLGWPGTWSIRNDGFALLRAGAPSGVGVALSAGTGAAVVSRGPDATPTSEWSASWWITHPLGGHALGSEALAAVVRAQIGLGEPTRLTEALLQTYGKCSVDALLELFSGRRGPGMAAYARAARVVLDVAGAGDATASRIVETQGEWYAAYAEVAARQAGFDLDAPFDVVLGGSVLQSDRPHLRDAVRAGLAQRLPNAHPVLSPRPPVVGALLQALTEAVGPLPDAVLSRVDRQPLPEDTFRT